MSKTVMEIGLIVGGLALAVAAGPVGILAMQGNVAMFNAMVGIGLSTSLAGVGLALRPGPRNSVGTQATISFSSGPAPRRVIYGQRQVAGVLTYASFPPGQNISTNSEYLHLIYTIAGHEISSFDGVIVNGTPYNFGTEIQWQNSAPHQSTYVWQINPGNNSYYNDLYWEHMFFEFDFGRNNSAQPFPNLANVDNSWTSACVQQGCAKVHVLLRYDSGWPNVYPSGSIPNIQFLVTGKKLTDPRVVTAWAASTGYSEYQYIIDNLGIIWVQTNSSGTSGATRPAFETNDTPGTVLADGTLSWRASGEDFTSISMGTDNSPQGHIVNGRLVNDAWQPGAGYAPYDMIEAPIGYLQMATNSGLCGSTEPAFATTLGGTTTDNTQDWVCLGRSPHAINPSNPALVVSDYLQDTDYGLRAPASTVDFTSVIAAANICEQQALIIWNSDNTVVYENLYSCDGTFDHSSNRGDVLDGLCGSMAGWVIPPGDMWHIAAGAYVTPTVSLGDTDLRGAIKGDFRLSQREVCNTVRGRFTPAFLPTNPAAAVTLTQVPGTWQEQSYPAYQANGLAGKPDYLNTEDGGQIIMLSLNLEFTTSLWAAQRLAKIALMRTRFQQTLTLPFKLSAFEIEAGDTFYFTHARWSMIDSTLQAEQAAIAFDTTGGAKGEVPYIACDIISRQVDPSIYEFQGPSSASDFGEYSPYGVTGIMTGVE